ncbi:UNVERIFIED_CONTAM: hypothetical protein GTU68_020651 [Idotea baltica]|nr:hypothetical protein [Idotea baltica]
MYLVQYEHLPEEILLVIENIQDPGILSDILIAHYRLDNSFAQNILEELDPIERLKIADKIISDDLNHFVVSENIKDKARDRLNKGQRDYYLREQLREIQIELGEQSAGSDDLDELKGNLKKANLPEHALKESNKQLKRLERMPQESSEYSMLRTYLEWFADLPWSISTKDRVDLKAAKKILDQEHYGLEKAKNRIIEYLSVKKLKNDSKGPILCFVGPPGVGKTSLGRSVSKCLKREFFRISLGGVRDEAEIRGHRRTYVGALPGKIIQGLKETGSNNPVFVLDEIDKLGADFRGDPASALLEILDPEQNKEFRDHYLNIDFDLSNAMFIATSNTLDTIPPALLDRLEIVSIPGYTIEEKVTISKRHLIPRQLEAKGLGKKKIQFNDAAIKFLVERYTREAGVRNLEREIGSISRKLARKLVEKKRVANKITQVPGGAIPKDGPSAGIAIASGLISVLTNRKVNGKIAMTGEMTLRGNVLPIGGLKEKALAALRYGVKKVIIPAANVKDLEDIAPEQRKKIEFIPVKHISEVLDIMLLGSRPKISKSKTIKQKVLLKS